MQKFIRILFAAAAIALAVWVWWTFFPSPERAVRTRLKNLAKIVSFEAGEGTISKGYKAQKLTDFFPVDVEINIDIRGYPPQNITGRDEIMRGVLFAQSQFRALKVVFPDINVKVGADKQSAVANLTVEVTFGSERDSILQELNVTLKKVEGRWLIFKIETVKTLSQSGSEPTPMASHES